MFRPTVLIYYVILDAATGSPSDMLHATVSKYIACFLLRRIFWLRSVVLHYSAASVYQQPFNIGIP